MTRLRLLAALLPALLLAPLFAQEPQAPARTFEIPATDDGLPGEGPIRRYDWFRKLWQQKRSTWAGRVEQDKGAVVFLGDSITQGWGDDLGGTFGEMQAANRGISGDTTRGMLVRLDEDVLALDPAAVVILAGTNDLEEGAEPETIVANLKRIVEAIEKHDPKTAIVLCKVFPSSASKKRPTEKIVAINEQLAAAVKGDDNVVVLETWVLFANEAGDAKKEEFPDLLHPNKAGYAKWAAAVRPILATLGHVEAAADDFTPEPVFESLFNGRDLTGWGFRPTAPANPNRKPNPNAPPRPVVEKAIDFDGKTATPDGRYIAINGRLVVTTPTEGRRIQQLWTTREFPNDFELRLEFRATPYADSGVFIRQPQLQCRDFLLAGPYTQLKKYRSGDWNELVVTVTGNEAHCTCNGEVLEESLQVPDTGGIGLEGDRGQMEYRRIRIKVEP